MASEAASAAWRQAGVAGRIARQGLCLAAAAPQNNDFRESNAQRDYSQAPDLSPPKPLSTREAVGWGLLIPTVGFAVVRFAGKRKGSRPEAKSDRLGSTNGQAAENAASQRLPGDTNKKVDSVEVKAMGSILAKPNPEGSGAQSTSQEQALEEFFSTCADRFTDMRNLFSEISRSQNDGARQKILSELCAQMGAFKVRLGAFDLRPAWQMASCLEGLLEQIAERMSNLTPSALRTVAGAIVLLEKLCRPGLRADLTTYPAAQFLAVDDDAISRHAVCASLKKTLGQPEVAKDGPEALQLVPSKRYDLVFLDVDMPGMDGFELCSKIRETETNRNTPVVFVTSHSDFDSRARSADVGGHDLIAKPFLPFEITVKALMLVIRSRLEGGAAEHHGLHNGERTGSRKGKTAAAPATAPVMRTAQEKTIAANIPEENKASANKQEGKGEVEAAPVPQDSSEACMSHAPEQVFRLRNLLVAASDATDEKAVREALGEVFVGIHALTADAERAELKAVYYLSWGVERLLRKTLDQRDRPAASILQTATTALDAIEELCRRRARFDMKKPPVQILVVDDDPVARRAMCTSLQLGFGRPDCGDDGEAGVLLAREKAYDVIFMDVLMPGMDGFAACSKIREGGLSSATPIIFVSSLGDQESQEKSAKCGGNAFITKPALPAETALMALTFAVLRRLGRGEESDSARVQKEVAGRNPVGVEAIL